MQSTRQHLRPSWGHMHAEWGWFRLPQSGRDDCICCLAHGFDLKSGTKEEIIIGLSYEFMTA